MSTLRERVERGAARLDKEAAGKRRVPWRSKVDLPSLDLVSPCKCTLGQVYGSYGAGLRALDISFDDDDFEELEVGCGFFSAAIDSGPLRRAWRKYIEATP